MICFGKVRERKEKGLGKSVGSFFGKGEFWRGGIGLGGAVDADDIPGGSRLDLRRMNEEGDSSSRLK